MPSERNFKKILITGITGAGGSQLAEYIIKNHPEIELHGTSRGYTTPTDKNIRHIASKINFHKCDYRDLSSVLTILKNVKPDAIYHFAAFSQVQGSLAMPKAVTENNIMGNINLFEAIRLSGIDPYILLASSPEVYGDVPQEKMPITEEHPKDPQNPYSISKSHQEDWARMCHNEFGMKTIITRMFAYINPRRKDIFSTSFATQVARIEQGLQENLTHGDLGSQRTLIDVRDCAEAYWQALNKCEPGQIYNICGKTVKSAGEFLEDLKALSTVEIKSEVDPSLLRKLDIKMQLVDSTKFKEATGWEPKYEFQDTIKFLLDGCRKDVADEVNTAQ